VTITTSPETDIKRNLQKTFPGAKTMYACMALVLTPKMLAVTFASFAVLVLAGGWIDYDSYDS